MDKKNILLIAYKFPPYSRVGSHRWKEQCKNLANMGHKVTVVTVNWRIKDKINWIDEVTHPNITIHRIKSGIVKDIKYMTFGKNIPGRILHKLRNQIDKLINIFYYMDETQFWGKTLIPYCKKLIQNEDFCCIVATGAPFMVNYHASCLWNEIKRSIPLVQDFQDEWYSNNKFLFPFQRSKSNFYADYAVNNCSMIFTTSYGMQDFFKKLCRTPSVRFEIIQNGFDKMLTDSILESNTNTDREFSFVYAGSLGNGRNAICDIFLDIISNNHNLFPGIKIYFYTDSKILNYQKYKHLIADGILHLCEPVGQKELFTKISSSFCTLHFMPDTQYFVLSIKLFEYAALKRPVLSLNNGGDTKRFINEFHTGFSVDYSDSDGIIDNLNKLYTLWKKDHNYSINPENIEQFSYSGLSDKIIDKLQKL